MEKFIERMMFLGYSRDVASSICGEFMRELGPDFLDSYIRDIEAALVERSA